MTTDSRIERALAEAVARAEPDGPTTRLAAGIRHAVLGGGARVRPRLCLAVAEACGATDDPLVEQAAVAIELLHCASLVHDDLPCFDNATLRRGSASVHAAFGERIAILTGDALIVAAFQALSQGAASQPTRLPGAMAVLGQAVGAPDGIVAGQAMECEDDIDIDTYQKAKTGALFGAATMLGAAAAGAEPRRWQALGTHIGHAYQVVDDIRDLTGCTATLGKPAHQDDRLGRPNAARLLGLDAAHARFDDLMDTIVASVPSGFPGSADLRARLVDESAEFFPMFSAYSAA